MASRRPHTKSRLGCAQCKIRKVKCDQAAPTCSNCVRRNQICSLTEVHLHLAKSLNSTPIQSSSPKSISEPSHEQYTSSLHPTIYLELTHFYATKTWSTIMTRPRAASPWRDELFASSLSNPILLDALLVTAAMHRLTTVPDCSNKAELAVFILDKGTGVIPHVIEMIKMPSEENCIFLMSSSIMLTIWAFGSINLPQEANLFTTTAFADSGPSKLHPCNKNKSRLNDLLKVLNFTQGTRAVATGLPEMLISKGFGSVLETPDIDSLPATPIDVVIALDSLEEFNKTHSTAFSVHGNGKEYSIQIERLKDMFRIRQCPEWHDIIVGFAVMLPRSMIALSMLRDPSSLAILAFWAACLRAMDDTWWVKGWSEALFHEISSVISDDWKGFLQVPAQFF